VANEDAEKKKVADIISLKVRYTELLKEIQDSNSFGKDGLTECIKDLLRASGAKTLAFALVTFYV